MAGNGVASKGRYIGIAPECNLVCGKVLNSKGGGSIGNLIDGLEWIIDMKKVFPINILNLSIEIDSGIKFKDEEIEVMNSLLRSLWELGTSIVVAAGNRGPNPMSISVIGDNGYCICVGCHDKDYIGLGGKCCSQYSGRGPGKNFLYYGDEGNPLMKPDIVTPGTDIVSCNNNFVMRGTRYINAYIKKSGTSMSAPIISGAFALGLQKYPQKMNKDLCKSVQNSAKDLGDYWSVQGAGMICIDNFIENLRKT